MADFEKPRAATNDRPVVIETLAASLRERECEPRVKRMWDRIDAARGGRDRATAPLRSSRRPVVALVSVLAIAAAVLLAFPWLPHPPAALTIAGDEPLSGAIEGGSVVDLSDGSRIEADEAAHLDVLESSPRTVSLGLRHGRARFLVTPGGPRAWHIECGGVTVDVVGTIFTVDRDGEHVTVSVERGSVLVRGDDVPDHTQRLDAGHSLVVGPPEPELAPEPTVVAVAPAAPEPAVDEVNEPPARRGSEDPVGDLLADADEARRSGDDPRAVRLLDAIVARHADDPRAALAAYTLGRVRLDRLGELRAAARSFARALELGLPDELAEGARAGRAIALARAHDPAADGALGEYLANHPDGRSREEVLRAEEAP